MNLVEAVQKDTIVSDSQGSGLCHISIEGEKEKVHVVYTKIWDGSFVFVVWFDLYLE